MVDFRYHLVTIIGIFLALALGIVVGTTQLNGQVLDDLNGRVDDLASDKRNLEEKILQQRTQTEADESLLGSVATTVVADVLRGERVVLVSTPNAPRGLSEGLVPILEAAGATLGTQVSLRPDLLDPTKLAEVGEAVDRAATPGLDREGTAVEVAARELAGALLEPVAGSGAALTDEQATATLEALTRADLVDVDGDVQPRGTMVVLLTGEAVAGADPDGVRARVDTLLAMAGELDARSRGLVVAGPLTAVDEGGLVRALREDDALDDDVSSVDGVDKPQGRIVTVLALREQGTGDSGHYGTGADSDGALPSEDE